MSEGRADVQQIIQTLDGPGASVLRLCESAIADSDRQLESKEKPEGRKIPHPNAGAVEQLKILKRQIQDALQTAKAVHETMK